MEVLPDELYDNIFGFLSAKEKLIVREVCILFESRIKDEDDPVFSLFVHADVSCKKWFFYSI